LQFRLDEVRGELAQIEERHTQQVDELTRLEAALRGTVRGLNARLSEVIELHQQAQARLALAEEDRITGQARQRDLVRELTEARELLELHIARTETMASRKPGSEVAERRVEEVNASLEAMTGRLDGLRRGFELRIAELVQREHASMHEAEA